MSRKSRLLIVTGLMILSLLVLALSASAATQYPIEFSTTNPCTGGQVVINSLLVLNNGQYVLASAKAYDSANPAVTFPVTYTYVPRGDGRILTVMFHVNQPGATYREQQTFVFDRSGAPIHYHANSTCVSR